MEARQQEPSVALQGYGGGRIDIVRQMLATISHGSYSREGIVYIQKDPPVDLLLGTDFQSYLGLLLVDASNLDEMVYLFTGQRCVNVGGEVQVCDPYPSTPSESKPTECCSESRVTVHLIQATRVPERHARLVRARVESPHRPEPALFGVYQGSSEEADLLVEEGVVEANSEGCIALVVQNWSSSPILLEEGQVLGDLRETQLMSVGDFSETELMSVGAIARTDADEAQSPRAES